MRDFIRSYRASLKAVEVEEPIDLAVHRPLAFLLAKLSERTPLAPNHLTLLSMTLGISAGGVLVAAPRLAGPLAGALLFSSQVVDCSDGMLARMRKTSSEVGRMLDGVADSIALGGAVLGATWSLIREHSSPGWLPWLIVVGAALTVQTSSLHTAAYDHYKNLHLALTLGSLEEDVEGAMSRRRVSGERRVTYRILFWIYSGYLVRQARFLSWFDPRRALAMARSRHRPPSARGHTDCTRVASWMCGERCSALARLCSASRCSSRSATPSSLCSIGSWS